MSRPTSGRRVNNNAKKPTGDGARQAIEQAAAELGGAARLAAWASESNENETVFWTRIFPRLLQLAHHIADDPPPIVIQITENDLKHG